MARDEVSYLLERMERQSITVEKPCTESIVQTTDRERFLQLVREVTRLLRGGQWIPRKTLAPYCRQFGFSFDLLGDTLGLAESDDGKFVSWPNDRTPETEPKKKRRHK